MKIHDMDLLFGMMNLLVNISSSYGCVELRLVRYFIELDHVDDNLNMEHHTIFQHVLQSLHLTNAH